MKNWTRGWFGFHDPTKFGRLPDPLEPIEQENLKPEVGDWLRCKDRDDMINTMHDLIMEGIETDFRYTHNGENGLWLEVIKIDN